MKSSLVLACICVSVAQAQQYIVTTAAGSDLPPTPVQAINAAFSNPISVAADAAGNVYVAANNCVFRVDASGTLTRVAGRTRQPGYSGDGGLATAAQLNLPGTFANVLSADGAGNLYISDIGNNVVRKVSANGIITTVAGNGTAGFSGDNGSATSAQLSGPAAVASDAAGNLYIADSENQRVRKVATNGIITTVAGNGTAGSTGDSGPATAAALSHPHGLAIDAAGNLYIADNSARIRKVGTDGMINTVAGNGSPGSSGDGGPATNARISGADVSVDPAGNIYFAEGNRVRRVSIAGSISTVAGNGSFANTADEVPATSVAVCAARVTVDSAGNQFLADQCGSRIRKVTVDSIIHATSASGLTPYSGDGSPATSAQLNTPRGITVDNAGNILIADTGNHRVRKLQTDGTIVTVAGTGVAASTGDGGPATSAALNTPYSVLADAAGNVYIGTFALVRKVAPNGTISTIAGTGVFGYSGDNGPALSAKIGDPRGMALDSAGNLYLAETTNSRIRKIAPNGVISTVTGTGVDGYSGDGGPASAAQIQAPWGLAVDAGGNLYFADFLNQRVRKVSNGVITTVAGNGGFGSSGDGGLATNANVSPSGVAVDAAGNMFITETGFPNIRKVAANGIISTVAGTGAAGYSGDGGPAINASFSSPSAPKLEQSGNLYFADGNTIRVLTAVGGNPILSVTKTHTANFQAGQLGALYTVTVTNNAAAGPTSGSVTVTDLVPSGLTFQSMFGAGWNCIPSGCTRNDVLNAGASYPPVTVSVNVPADAPAQVTNQVVVSGGHAAVTSTFDVTTIPELPNPVLTAPANGANSISLTPALNWSAVAGAASYDVYFGTSSTPPLVSNTAATGYSPAGLLSNTTYYWRVVAKSGARAATSTTFSFSTTLVQIQISGNAGASGTLITLSGSQSGAMMTDVSGNYQFSGLSAGGTYTVTPSLSGYGFSPQSQTFPNLTVSQTANFAAVAFQCVANSGVPPTARAEGFTELLGDVVLNCTGGTSTPGGTVIPQADVTVTLNTQITSRIVSGGGEILLSIDEPSASQAILCVPGTANPGAPTAASSCPVMGTNGSATEFKSGNSNVIRGTVSGNTVTFTGVPVDPPGPSGSRIYRITNLRGDATGITASVQSPGQITGLVQVAGLTVANPTQPVAIVLPSVTRTLRTSDNSTALTTPAAFQSCGTASGQRFATLEFLESFPAAFKTRTLAGTGITAQNTLAMSYNTESGYYNSNLPVSLGLADSGTRLKAVFNNIPAGVSLYTSTGLVTFTNGVPQPGAAGNVLTVPQAALTSTETGAFSPVAATQTLDGIPAAALTVVNGSATAVWEITGANSLSADAYDFPLWITFNGASTGTATVSQNYAPAPPAFSAGGGGVAQDAGYPLPRFADSSSAGPLIQIAACTSTVQLTFSSVPSGQPVLLDGILLTTPQTVNWVQGTNHSIGAPLTVQGSGARYNFANWSDGGAQTHSIVVPSSPASYTLNYNAQYLLTLSASPVAGGSVAANPPSPAGDGYYDSGASVQVTATATAPYQFTGFSGALSGTTNPQTVIMNAPATVTAGFFARAAMASPAPGSVLTDTAATFNWGGIGAASYYSLDIGTAQGLGNIFSQNVGLLTSQSVTGLPANGSTIYVRLSTQIGSVVQFNDYTYTAVTIVPKATLTSPTPGSTLAGASVTFNWSAAAGASSYSLEVGTAQGAANLFSQNVGLLTSQAVSGIPTDGSTVYVRLWTQSGSVLQFNDYTYTASSPVPKASITSPTPGSTLPGSTVTFTWNAAAGATAYSLDIGTAPGSAGIFSQNAGLATSQLVSVLPTNGSIVYVRLWTQTGSTLQFNDYTYIAATAATKATLTSPTPGSTLPGVSATFAWTAGAGASAYWLDVGTVQGQGTIFGSNVGLALSQTVNGIPTTGGTIYVRLWSQINGVWSNNDYTFTAATLATKAVMTSPTPGATFGAPSVTFTWSAAAGASAYWLDVGTLQGQGTIFAGNLGLSLSQTVNGIPTTGGTIYVRLWTQQSGVWSFNDYTYTAATLGTKATMVSPAPGSAFSGTAVTFTWSAGAGASAYWLDVGTIQGQGTIFGNNVGLVTSKTVSGIPVNGGTIFVRLWTQQSGVWSFNDYTYTAANLGTKAVMLSPAPGSTLSGAAVTFTWSAGAGASAYWLDVGTIQGQGTIFGNNVGLVTSQAVSGIPASGGTIYVRLWTQQSGVWSFNDYTYTAATLGAKAVMLSPAPGSTLSGSTVTFTWSAGAGASAYWLDVGTIQGQGNIFGTNVGLTTSQAVAGIPANGSPIYVRLWTQIAGAWQVNDYTYTANH